MDRAASRGGAAGPTGVDTLAIVGAVRFWTREIWGPRWSAERRHLLLKHYWSYVRRPAIPPVHVARLRADLIARQQEFCSLYSGRIAAVQHRSQRRRGVRLTYRPLGKNVRLLGTAVRRNVDAGEATVIEPDGPPDEIRALAASGRSWHPWLWSRTGTDDADANIGDAAAAWTTLFKPLNSHRANPLDQQLPLLAGAGPYDASQLTLVLKIAVATRAVFQPIDQIEVDVASCKAAMGWPPPHVPVLGLHVRRSDAASAEADGPANANRRSFALSEYLDAVDRLCDAGNIRHVFLATESAVEIERAKELRPQYTFLIAPHDRSLFPDISVSKQFIEHLVMARPDRARALAVSAVVDLRLLCECRAFVGAFNSEFSVLAWLLAIGSQGHLIPYQSLSHPAARLSLHPQQALLTAGNNCPLELYHW
jgi:hypothetical protein